VRRKLHVCRWQGHESKSGAEPIPRQVHWEYPLEDSVRAQPSSACPCVLACGIPAQALDIHATIFTTQRRRCRGTLSRENRTGERKLSLEKRVRLLLAPRMWGAQGIPLRAARDPFRQSGKIEKLLCKNPEQKELFRRFFWGCRKRRWSKVLTSCFGTKASCARKVEACDAD